MISNSTRRSALVWACYMLAGGARGDLIMWQPTCDTVWQSCCDLNANTKQNNWGQTGAAPVCPPLPSASDDVTIVGDCTVGPTPAVQAGTISQSGGIFTLNGGSLGIATEAVFDGPFVWNSGTLTRASSYGTATMNGGFYMAGNAGKKLSTFGGFRLVNNGLASWSGQGDWTMDRSNGVPSVFENGAGATFDVQNDAKILQTSFGTGRIENAGRITKQLATGVSEWLVELVNTGTVRVQSGELKLTGTGELVGCVRRRWGGDAFIFRAKRKLRISSRNQYYWGRRGRRHGGQRRGDQ